MLNLSSASQTQNIIQIHLWSYMSEEHTELLIQVKNLKRTALGDKALRVKHFSLVFGY